MLHREIVRASANLRTLLDNDYKEIQPQQQADDFEFDPSDTEAFIAQAKWRLSNPPRRLVEAAIMYGAIVGMMVGVGMYGQKELENAAADVTFIPAKRREADESDRTAQ